MAAGRMRKMAGKWLLITGSMALLMCGLASGGSDGGNVSRAEAQRAERQSLPQCQDGLLIPRWEPAENLSTGDRVARGLVYFLAMIYLFIGVSIVADRFMGAIEVITSKEKEVKVRKADGEIQIVVVRVWNETVANLSLMALGSSAPEILLSIIEVYAKDFNAGDLGPGTIVGSAAFNLFMIIGLCVYVIPDGEVRKIKHLRVFFVTAAWSIFAYVWLYLILAVFSYGEVEIWEGVLTFLFFPATVWTAYVADKRLLIYKYISKEYRMNRRGIIVETEGGRDDVELADKHRGVRQLTDDHFKGSNAGFKTFDEEKVSEEVREFEEHRREYIQLLRDLRKKHPDLDMRRIESLAHEQLANSGPKSRAFYRIQATRKLTGGSNPIKKAIERSSSDLNAVVSSAPAAEDQNVIRVYFDPGHYTVMENVGEFAAQVRREGGDAGQPIVVDYRTEDGSASAGSDYIACHGSLLFKANEAVKTFNVAIIDDDVFEEDEHFYIRLSNARLYAGKGADTASLSANGDAMLGAADARSIVSSSGAGGKCDVELVAPFLATVMILDDDHCGIYNLAERDVELVESVGVYSLKVTRWSGARGRVSLPYRTVDGTAKEAKDFVAASGEIIFENNEIEKFIDLQIIEENSYEKDVLFYVEIDEPTQLDDLAPPTVEDDHINNKPVDSLTEEEKVALLGRPRLGEVTRAQIRIKESKEFKNTVDKLVQRANNSLAVGTSTWKEQFIEAITVNPGDDDDDEEGGGGDEEKMPTCGDYVLHFLTLFWKILFAFVPPTDRLGGWLCFIVAIIWIGILTAVIGDVASAFGCSVGLLDSVTAVAFVALGTSVPDTFASKVAAVQDRYADASVGNVTGSNAVNVFLGIGIAWSIAAIHKKWHGKKFEVKPGSLAFSVTLFCTTACLAMGIMMLRRHKSIGGELGGPKKAKALTSFIFVSLWLFYVLMSSLEAYGVIQGF